MATIHKGKRSLSGAAARILFRILGYLLAALFYGGLLLHGGVVEWVLWLPLPVAFFCAWFSFRRYKKMKAGALGEKILLRQLKGLPGHYHIFTNYVIRRERGWDEIDFIVVGETGVFVLEAKHHTGRIESIAGGDWRQTKFRAGGKTEHKAMANPVKQTKRHQANLVKLLKNHEYVLPVAALLVFTNPRAELIFGLEALPVIKGAENVNGVILAGGLSPKLSRKESKEIAVYLKKAAGD